MHGLTALLADLKTQMLVRTGISAVFEELAGSKALHDVIPELQQLTLSELSQARVSACHFLALASDPDATPIARRLLDDEDPNVREIARETLAALDDTSPPPNRH